MYRILPCTKDTYLQNKYVNSSICTDANVGQAGSLDLYKLYEETYISGSSGLIEMSRLLLKFDYSSLYSLTSSILNIADSSFKCFLSLKDIYGGQTVPSNFTLVVHPLAKYFDEGRGSDVIAYRDIDTANWLTASYGAPWEITGSSMSGNLGAVCDYYVSGNLGAGVVGLGVQQRFNRGDEDLNIDITTLVSATIAGIIPDYGFRVAYCQTQEENSSSYFVKRFSSRHVRNPFETPTITVEYADAIIDNQRNAALDVNNTVYTYSTYFGQYRNFVSKSVQITGSNCLRLDLIASKSMTYYTTGWSTAHSATISYITTSFTYYSTSLTGSQLQIGSNYQTGVYFATFQISSSAVSGVSGVLDTSTNTVAMLPLWKSLDGTVLFSSASYFNLQNLQSISHNVLERNFVVNITNLKYYFTQDELCRFRVFIQDYNTELRHNRIPVEPISEIYKYMYWRLKQGFTNEIIIPFGTGSSNSTRLSCDAGGMYFDMYMKDLAGNQAYQIEFLIRDENQDYIVVDQGFRFKIIS